MCLSGLCPDSGLVEISEDKCSFLSCRCRAVAIVRSVGDNWRVLGQHCWGGYRSGCWLSEPRCVSFAGSTDWGRPVVVTGVGEAYPRFSPCPVSALVLIDSSHVTKSSTD